MPRPRISISVKLRDGHSSFALPRSFRGQLTLTKRGGSIALSSSLQACASLLISSKEATIYAINGRDISQPEADELVFEGRDGGVSLMFDDESMGSR
jgi:hypothetical protein